MIQNNKLYILLFVLCYFLFSPLRAQQNSSTIDKEKWEKIAEKYDYSSSEPIFQQETKRNIDFEPGIKKAPLNTSTSSGAVLKYSLFALVIILLVFIGYRLIRNGKFWDKKIEKPKVYSIENIEENLKEADIVGFLVEALQNNNHRLAVRLMYLNLLKEMTLKDFIVWKKDKTNGDYLFELRKSELHGEFGKCTLAYEFVWFNEQRDFALNQYNNVKPVFDNFLNIINKTPKKTTL